MLRIPAVALLTGLLLLPSGSIAQVGVPPLGGVLDRLGNPVGHALGTIADVSRGATDLAQARAERLSRFVTRNPAQVEFDAQHRPARRGVLLILDPTADDLRIAAGAGFAVIAQGSIEGLDLPYAQLAAPERLALGRAETALRLLLPRAQVTADQLYFPSGSIGQPAAAARRSAPPRPAGTVGVIDGGVVAGGEIAAQAGFAAGAPRPSPHAQSIRSLLAGAGTARLFVADVYGSDPAGGNALAIARALGWMIRQDVPVVSISLVGPANPLVGRAIDQARARGLIVVAAVGNDGPAAPAAFPASYPGVIAVTGVDRQDRVLFEAGKADHLDYAAPGADLTAIALDGRRVAVRGTSFAAPLAAARIAALRQSAGSVAQTLQLADREALRRGSRVGRGVLCAGCRRGS